MLTEATAENIRRKSAWVDRVQMVDGVPLFSWLDLNPLDLCNRACSFCPRSDQAAHPNQKLYMDVALAASIAEELHSLEYEGVVVFCGTGEPLLHPRFTDLVRPFKGLQTELVTNGDRLTPAVVENLFDAGLTFIAVSMYDGPEQIEHFQRVFSGVPSEKYILRDRWQSEDDDFGLKLTNRAGTVDVGHQSPVELDAACWYLQYCMTISWNGDILLCPQDWNGRIRFGNAQSGSLLEIWKSSAMMKRRKQLLRGRAGLHPCQSCNCDGKAHGATHVDAWAAA